MRPFLDDNFLFKGETAIDLYHNFAKDMPIIDYHCHFSPKEIYENKTFRNLTDVWLSGDHYKWRALRSNGVEERLITGDATIGTSLQLGHRRFLLHLEIRSITGLIWS